MRSPLRTSIVSALAAALVLAVSTTNSAGAHPAPGIADRSVARISQGAAHQVLERVAADLKSRPATGLGHYRDLTVLLLDLRHAMAYMSPRDAAQARAIYEQLPQTSPQPDCIGTVIASDHFCVHYTANPLSPDNATPEQAQLTSDTLEHVYAYEVGTLGYRPPVDDGDGRTDVTLADIGNASVYGGTYYGACSPATNAVKTEASCILDNDFSPNQFPGPTNSLGDLEVTAAHEFFHAIQFGYNTYREHWLLEGTAVWMEDQVYPSINDYLQYVRRGGAIVTPRTPIDTDDQSQWYAATLFWKFLSESRHDPSIIKQVWNSASTYVNRTALQDVVNVLAARRLSFPAEFGLFGVWNTLPPNTYVDRSLYPAPAYWARARLTPSSPGTGWRTVALNHLTNASMIIRPSASMPRRAQLRVSVTAQLAGTRPWFTVQVRLRTGKVLIYEVYLNRFGAGSRVVGFNPHTVASVVLIGTNASTYGVDNRTFKLRARALL